METLNVEDFCELSVNIIKYINYNLIINVLISVLLLLGSCAYAIVLVVERSKNMEENPGWLRENEVTLVVAGVGFVYPNIFNFIARLEAHHPRIQLRWQLAR